MKTIEVYIVDDHSLVIGGVHNLLDGVPGIQISGEFMSGNELMAGLEHKQPDVLLLDILLPDINGKELALLVKNRYPAIKIIALSSLDAPTHVKTILRNGCEGYLLKNTRKEVMIEAIQTVFRGEEYIDAALEKKMLHSFLNFKNRQKKEKDVNLHNVKLTRREKEILALVIKEFTNQQIADKLFISVRTVEFHRRNLQQKLDVKTPVGLLKIAIDLGVSDV